MEGVERRLTESHDRIDQADTSTAREESAVADIDGIEVAVRPPVGFIRALDERTGFACPQAFQIVWPKGALKNLPITGFCAEPLCADTGECTGPRFVPHIDQWNGTGPDKERRTPSPEEIIAASRAMARRAELQTHVPETRSDSEILAHVKMVWQKTIASIRGDGGTWRRG
jgi:hypothetical protein